MTRIQEADAAKKQRKVENVLVILMIFSMIVMVTPLIDLKIQFALPEFALFNTGHFWMAFGGFAGTYFFGSLLAETLPS